MNAKQIMGIVAASLIALGTFKLIGLAVAFNTIVNNRPGF